MEQDEAGSAQYWAFISYSHKDAAFARRLHRQLESYALPRRLVGSGGALGQVPKRLSPIFRDREELSAAHDLSAEVRTALKASRSLVIVCSPAAAASQWVAREIEAFRALNPGAPILAAIRDGEPDDCYPGTLVAPGTDGARIEPLAADFRRGRDGEQLGLLKLVAGIVGLRLDELIQRDAHRRYRRVTAVTAGALAVALVMGVSALFALQARGEAERQRGEAEGLVGFMNTDLRERLDGVGRLDVMRVVNDRALQYFDRQASSLRPNARAIQASLLQAQGQVFESRGDSRSAVAKFQQAYRITDALLAADAKNPERQFDHAQSVYWIGYDDFINGRYVKAKVAFEQYWRLARRMLDLAPDEPRYVRELAFAEGDLCSIAFYPPKDPAGALAWCAKALDHMSAAVRRMSPSSTQRANLVNRYTWLADAFHANGDENRATEYRLTAAKMLDGLMKDEPMNMDFKTDWIALQRNLARVETRNGELDKARDRLVHASILIDQMVVFDPSNDEWRQQKKKLDSELSNINKQSERKSK